MKKLILSLSLMLICTASWAQDENKPQTPPMTQVQNDFLMATSMARYGYSNRSAISLIEAARISIENGFAREGYDKEDVDESGVENKKGKMTLDPTVLLADARALSEGNAPMLNIIENLENGNSTRGRVGGDITHRDRVIANHTDVYHIRFRGGEMACVIVSGDGDTDLDLYIYDSNGILVTSDTDSTDTCVCRWYPSRTQQYRIEIKNWGHVYNEYVLMTN